MSGAAFGASTKPRKHSTSRAMKPAGAYAIYFAFALVSFFFVRGWVQETKGKTLEEM